MDIGQQLLKEHSRTNADRIIEYVLGNRARMAALMEIFLHGESHLVQRAAMVVGDLGRLRPEWIQAYHLPMIEAVVTPIHPAVRRNVMRYFSEQDVAHIGSEEEGNLVGLALEMLEDPREPVANRVHAMQLVYNFCARYPELKGELYDAIAGELAESSPGFKSRGTKILRALDKAKEG